MPSRYFCPLAIASIALFRAFVSLIFVLSFCLCLLLHAYISLSLPPSIRLPCFIFFSKPPISIFLFLKTTSIHLPFSPSPRTLQLRARVAVARWPAPLSYTVTVSAAAVAADAADAADVAAPRGRRWTVRSSRYGRRGWEGVRVAAALVSVFRSLHFCLSFIQRIPI
jgi:hypothetical protein